MPRLKREIRPGDVVHVICSFVNDEFRITCPEERDELLRRLGGAILECDWEAISYAAMSSHYHCGLIAGFDPFEVLAKRVNSPLAGFLNERQGRTGPVFDGRPHTYAIDPVWTPRLVAYHHNNPPRAGVVPCARDSDWTSHLAYMGVVPRPEWLNVELGLKLMGFVGRGARPAFEAYVNDRVSESRDPELVPDARAEARRLREGACAELRLNHPRTGPAGVDMAPTLLAPRWRGDLRQVLDAVARATGLRVSLLVGRTRARSVTGPRRVFVVTARGLGARNTDIGLVLGVSEAAVRKLGRAATPREVRLGAALVNALSRQAA